MRASARRLRRTRSSEPTAGALLAGTVTFSVLADGKTLVTTPTIHGNAAAVPIDVDVTGAQVLELVVGDAGDGNGNDHGDWATPTVTCG